MIRQTIVGSVMVFFSVFFGFSCSGLFSFANGGMNPKSWTAGWSRIGAVAGLIGG